MVGTVHSLPDHTISPLHRPARGRTRQCRPSPAPYTERVIHRTWEGRMRQHTPQTTRTIGVSVLAVALLATSAVAIVTRPPPPSGRAAPAPAATIQDLGLEAFGVLPTIRPQDGNGLDFSQPGVPGFGFSPIVDYSGRHEQVRYVNDAML